MSTREERVYQEMNHFSPSHTGRLPCVRHSIAHTEKPDILPQLAHHHGDLHEVTLILSGEALCTVDHRRYHVTAGDVILCRAGVRHALLPRPSLCYYTILFDNAPSDLGADASLPANVYHCGDAMPNLQLLAALLSARTDLQPPAVQSHLLSALLLICAGGICAVPALTIDKASPAYAMSMFIDQHYGEDIFLSDIADVAGITSSHAIHVFKPVFDMSPVQHLNSRRIGQAQAALLLTGLSASQIASEIGIGNINYFYTVFKKLVGLSPTSYRAYFEESIHHCPSNSAIS